MAHSVRVQRPSSLQLVKLKHREMGSLSCADWIKLFISQSRDVRCRLNAIKDVLLLRNAAAALRWSLKPTECMSVRALESFIRQ